MLPFALALSLVLAVIAGCGSDDPVAAGPGPEDPSGPPPPPPPPPVAGEASLAPLPADATSRRVGLAVVIPDSGSGIASVEIWARPIGGAWEFAVGTRTGAARVTIPEAGPFGGWEFAATAVATDGAQEAEPTVAEASTTIPEPIYLTDLQGERWEITHAVNRYGMGLHGWEHGLGRFAIRALIDPPMSCPGDPDYPSPDNLAVVFGVAHGEDARAYKLGDLNDREVVDDTVGGAHVAVTY